MERGEGGVMESNELTKASFREAQNRPMERDCGKIRLALKNGREPTLGRCFQEEVAKVSGALERGELSFL